MMSMSPGMSAGPAAGYFSREDYYLRGMEQGENSQWCGKGAEALGLSGPVGEEEFRALCQGMHPFTGEQIVAPKTSKDKETGEEIARHRAGNDCTFSAPKSVSIAYAVGVEGVKEAHDAAVRAVVIQMEEHYSYYRTSHGIRSGALVAAKFDHATSRNLDPQLHSHVFLVNAVQAGDGSWRANVTRAIFQDQKSLGLLYRQELARQLLQRGFEVEIRDRSQMFIELKGMPPELMEHFSSRREAIKAQVELWKEEGKFLGVPHARLHEMAALETRDPKREVSSDDVVRAFERGFEYCGTSMQRVRKELEIVRQVRLAKEREPALPGESAAETVRLAAAGLAEREAVLDRARLLDEAVHISGTEHSFAELSKAIDGGARGVQRLGQDALGREYYCTVEMRRLEARNLEMVRELSGSFRSVTDPREVNGYLDRLEAQEGIRLTDGQRKHVVNELCGEHGVSVTQGDAGTGKTMASLVVERFNEEVLKPRGAGHFSINVAFTGKAAQEMSAACGRPSYTVEALLNARAEGQVRLQGEKEERCMGGGGGTIRIPQGDQVVLRVDEVSLVGAKQARHLIDFVKELQAEGVQAKLQLTGDTKQMQSIQAGDLFRQALELGREGLADVAYLKEINRQRDPRLLEIARGLNREDRPPGENAKEALERLKERGTLFEMERRADLVEAAVRKYLTESRRPCPDPEKAALGETQSVLLIASTNDDRRELNRQIREARLAAGELAEGQTFRVLAPAPQGNTADGYRVGQEVLFSGFRGEDGKMQRWGARLNTVGTVAAVDLDRNRVAVSYSFTSKDREGAEVRKTVTKTFAAAEMAGRTVVYREEERRFAAGDRVVALKNDRELGVQNGSLGVIRSLHQSGRAVVDFGGREVPVDLTRYRHLDHAYAVTIHKSQGTTVDHSIMFAPVRPPEKEKGVEGVPLAAQESYGRASYNALNVAVTRARYDACVFTNSLPGLTRAVEHLDAKTSTVGHVPEPQLPGQALLARRDAVPERKEPGRGTVAEGGTAHAPAVKVPERSLTLAARLDELARAGKPAPPLRRETFPKGVPAPPGRDVPKPAVPLPAKGMDLDLKK